VSSLRPVRRVGPRRRRTASVGVTVAVLLVLATACGSDDEASPSAAAGSPTGSGSSTGATATATVPDGWTVRREAGLRVATPEGFEKYADDRQSATSTYGVPYTDQPAPPPRLAVFVEEERVGPLAARVPLTIGNIEQELGVQVGPVDDVRVVGASEAKQFEYHYTTKGGESVTGATLEPTRMTQVDVLIDVPGLPKYGLRYSAPTDVYNADEWGQILASVEVRPSTSSGG
jgi:hypothetical protein